MILFRRGRVTSLISSRSGIAVIEVCVEGRLERAINYHRLTGPVEPGDTVLLNTTAVAKKLGTGGFHFVAAVEGRAVPDPAPEGHIMKLRYTPFQVKVLSVEEEEHPGSHLYRSVKGLGGLPVVVGELHSMIGPAAAALKFAAGKPVKVFYLMTDGAALPIWISRLVEELKEKGLIDETVTCGHAFGGDNEAINVFSGLLWARASGADAALVSMGPGIVGSATEFGHTGLEQGEIVNAVSVLGGRAVAIPRLSFGDARERHRGLSHHTATALGKVALAGCVVALPVLEGWKKSLVYRQLEDCGIPDRHRVVEVDTSPLPDLLEQHRLGITTMGRGIGEDPEFFHAAGAAGFYAAGLLQAGVDKAPDGGKRAFFPAQQYNQVAHPAGEKNAVPHKVQFH